MSIFTKLTLVGLLVTLILLIKLKPIQSHILMSRAMFMIRLYATQDLAQNLPRTYMGYSSVCTRKSARSKGYNDVRIELLFITFTISNEQF